MKKKLVCALALAAISHGASAQTLRDAVEAAWRRQPIASAQSAREAENDAKRLAAKAWTPAPPAIGLGHLSDQPASNDGQREWDAELGIPLWLPGQRDRQKAVVDAERGQLSGRLALAKWQIAGEVREAYWQWRHAENELALARRKFEEARAIVRQVDRRFQAGDVSRVDFNQALAASQAASALVAEGEVKELKARRTFLAITGLPDILGSVEEGRQQTAADLDEHPVLASIRDSVSLARARYTQAAQDRRDNPEIAFGMRRERSNAQAPFANTAMIRFRLPLATDARNQPRITAANAELIEVEAELRLQRLRVAAEIETARRELEQVTALADLAAARLRTATDNARLVARGFELGEFDVFTRLRAETERFEAELAATRARLEIAHAVSSLNQALGVLP